MHEETSHEETRHGGRDESDAYKGHVYSVNYTSQLGFKHSNFIDRFLLTMPKFRSIQP